MRRLFKRRGNSMVEFTFLGIPLMFVLISIFEVARGMWIYHTLAYAMKEATRFTIVKGANCISNGNSCGVTVGTIAGVIRDRGVGLLPDDLTVTMISAPSACTPPSSSGCVINQVGSATLTSLLSNATPWPTISNPADPGSYVGNDIVVTGVYPFRTAFSMFWPGSGGMGSFGVFTLGASAREPIQF